jgi:hypothetical protein
VDRNKPEVLLTNLKTRLIESYQNKPRMKPKMMTKSKLKQNKKSENYRYMKDEQRNK